MAILAKIIGALIFLWIVKRIYYSMRYSQLRSKYLAKWTILSMKEKELVMFAEHGFRLQQREDSWTADSRASGLKSFEIDYHIDAVTEIVENCPNFFMLTEAQLNREFYELLESHWNAMKAASDFDFHGTTAELDNLFSRYGHLSSLIFQRRKFPK